MSKHEDFSNTTIEVPISGTTEKLIVEVDFWHELRERGVTVVFMHDGRPHVSDPVENNRKHSISRLVMNCKAGFSARLKNADDPLNLTHSNLVVVPDGRAKYPALFSRKPVDREGLIDPDWIDPGVGYGDESEVHEDIEEVLLTAPDEPMATDQPIDAQDLILVIKDGHGLQGGLRSSRRVSIPKSTLGNTKFDPTDMQLKKLLSERARRDGAVLPTKGKQFKRFSKSYFNGGKVHKS